MILFKFIKQNIFVVTILVVSLFLRIYNLGSLMQLIPDQGWFYLSARDMLLTGHIPLVGPPTSHPWIHHGPLWTYALALLFYISRFNPVFPAYFIALLGTITTWLIYYIASKMFSKTVGIISSLLWATSPLIIMNSRIPYHTSPIPFFVLILLYLTYLWVKGNVKVFPLIMLLLAILYNHEITTFVFDVTVGVILLFGILKKKTWARGIFKKKLILLSIILFIIPMAPFLIYDTTHGYKQTVGFGVWVLYRIVRYPISFIHPVASSSPSLSTSLPEFFSYFQQLIFMPNLLVSLAILTCVFIYGVILLKKDLFLAKTNKKHKGKTQIFRFNIGSRILTIQNNLSAGQTLVLLFLGVAIPGLFLHRVPIEADTLLISPFVILLIALMFERTLKIGRSKNMVIIAIGLIGLINTYSLLSASYLTAGVRGRLTIAKQINAAERVISIAKGHAYNIEGKGELSSFPVFLMPYEYLLWWKGYPVSHNHEKVQIQIWEKGNTIIVNKMKW